MSDIPFLALAFIAGASLGALFFGGLWWTVQKGVSSESPALWFLGSVLLRTSVVLGGFYFVAQAHWSKLAACLLGFVIARTNLKRLVGEGLDERHAETETIFAVAARGSLHRDLVRLAAAASRFREGVRGRWKVPDAHAPATSTGVLRIALRPETPLCRAELCRRDHFEFLYSECSSRTEPKQSS